MDTLWHPLSALLFDDPRCFVTPNLLRMLMGKGTQLLYAGDRMWPAARHGDRLSVEPIAETPAVGDAVLLPFGGAVDLLRVEQVDGPTIRLCADADPDTSLTVAVEALLGRVPALTGDVPPAHVRARRRRRLDLAEALRETPDPPPDDADGTEADAASTVLDKYDFQAPQYARVRARALPDALLERLHAARQPPGRLLVIGSGVGRECFELEDAGWTVTGLDFSPQMVDQARQRAAAEGRSTEWILGDVRDIDLPAAAFAVAFTTFDVYSFLPRREERVEVLRRVHGWIQPRGVALISARLIGSRYVRSLTRKFRRGRPPGASHTRWIDGAGNLRRSFVQLFEMDEIAAEFGQGGFEAGVWKDGYNLLTPRTGSTPDSGVGPAETDGTRDE